LLRFFAAVSTAGVLIPLLPASAPAPGDFACFSIAARTFVASLPLTVSMTWLLRVRTRYGTAFTSNASLTSMTSSAFMETHDVDSGSVTGYEEARVCRTVVMFLHGPAHSVKK